VKLTDIGINENYFNIYSFDILYVFFIIQHSRREIIHYNVTNHPCAQWVVQQLREAFPFDSAPKYLIFDRDNIFSELVRNSMKSMDIKPKRISYQSPWQNGTCERWILSARADLLNHVIILNESHLRRLLKKYIVYYHRDRCHLALNRNTPKRREIQKRPREPAKVISLSRLGGLQHRYQWKDAA